MTDAYIFDHVRSPRGRGKSDGSLHEVTPVELLSQVLGSLRDRNELDTSRVDDVIMGVVHNRVSKPLTRPELQRFMLGMQKRLQENS